MTDARLTQAALEQWLTTNPQLQLTQTAVEHWATVPTTSVQAVVTQIALEQWVSVPADTGGGGGGPVVPGPSDPMWDVPTPTGVLQGVAAFNWDGTTWQPAGRAGPSVATPTGNLQGVAAFTGGPSWAPSGRAGPGVATPTGVLDGVAVYTWSGSQWTPPGGTETVPTPTGGLRGVAAFDWDGTAWQPAAQARSSVPTPYGVLDGVARFGWTGSAWAAVGAPSLSLNFMTPGTLDPRITFTRASTATYTDASGVIQMAAMNAPRWDYDSVTHALRGVLIEGAGINVLLNSGDPSNSSTWTVAGGGGVAAPSVLGNQTTAPDGTLTAARAIYPDTTGAGAICVLGANTLTATANPYSFSAWMKGAAGGERINLCITPDGALYYRFACVLTTQWQRFTLTTPNLTAASWFPEIGVDRRDATQTGSPAQTVFIWGAQIEQGAFASSYIPTTAAAVTRSADLASMAFTPAAPGTYQAEFIPAGAAASLPVIISGNAGSPVMSTGADSRLVASIRSGAAVFSGVAPALTFGAVNKTAFGWLTGGSKATVNGVPLGANAVALTVTGTNLQCGSDGVTPGNNALNGWLRGIKYWPRQLADAELQAVTT